MRVWIFPIKKGALIFSLAVMLLCVQSVYAETGFVFAGPITVPADASAAAKRLAVPAPGSLDALVIFAAFDQGNRPVPPVPSFAGSLFDRTRAGSLSHYYDTMSFGQFIVEGAVLSRRYQSDGPASAYVASAADQQGRYGEFVREILRRADDDIDFGQFDNDGDDGLPNSGDDDGLVDYIFVNVASTPAWFFIGNATGIGGLGLGDPFLSQDLDPEGRPIRILGHSSGGSVLREGNYGQTVGAMAHELGHHLGLPDLFDRFYPLPAEDSAGIGRWGLMAWGTLGWSGNDGPNPLSLEPGAIGLARSQQRPCCGRYGRTSGPRLLPRDRRRPRLQAGHAQSVRVLPRRAPATRVELLRARSTG